jgi:hypothetical protein
MSAKVIERGRATPTIVIARLDRATQYSRDVDDETEKPQRTGYSAFAEYDGFCEERKRRSNPCFLCGEMDCFAKPGIGRAFARPVGSQ